MILNNGGPAFPVFAGASDEGMSLRDWFAGQALAGYMTDENAVFPKDPSERERAVRTYATHCYKMADAMLAEKSRTETEMIQQ